MVSVAYLRCIPWLSQRGGGKASCGFRNLPMQSQCYWPLLGHRRYGRYYSSGSSVRTYEQSPLSHPEMPRRWSAASAERKAGTEIHLSNEYYVRRNGHHVFSPILLRDMCSCPKCVDPSTRQKLFCTADIPVDIQGVEVANGGNGTFNLRWENDIYGYDEEHITRISWADIESLIISGGVDPFRKFPQPHPWSSKKFSSSVTDIDYHAYMSEDVTLLQALEQLQTYGLLFISNVPESEVSVSAITERIGPLKNTFYGSTWDVRSVPQARNVAYTSQDLGFHMDLLYMKQPPHLQFLHCVRSSSAGGASLFADTYLAAWELLLHDPNTFMALSELPVHFHYNHPESHYYHQSRTVFELRKLYFDNKPCQNLFEYISNISLLPDFTWDQLPEIVFRSGAIDAVSWSPPFQAPFTFRFKNNEDSQKDLYPLRDLDFETQRWHEAARIFSQLIHRPDGIYERMMKPGECVIFDNRRVLHARRAFEAGDIGKERWLRGAYLDKDPYMSKLKVLQHRLGQ